MKIILYSIIAIIIMEIFIDGFYNDELAESMSRFNREMYYWCISNKTLLM